MKSLLFLWQQVALDLGDLCRVSTVRDYKTVTDRVNAEGESFLTISLPAFCVDFEQALAYGQVCPGHFLGFKRVKGLPRFLGGFLGKVFDPQTGVIWPDPSFTAIFAVRQLTRLYAKILLPCSEERTEKAFEAYLAIEDELADACDQIDEDFLRQFDRVSKRLFGPVLQRMDYLHATGGLVPKHGPGATADKLLGNQKYQQSKWHQRLEVGGFVSTDFLLPNARYYQSLESVQFVDPEHESPVRVISVPKTLKAPRIIAIEPTCMQYAQQAVAEALTREIRQDKILGSMVLFRDQQPNQMAARLGSKYGNLATLDLSEASDRVSNQLVKILMRGYTHFSEGVQACRSLTADVPGKGVIPLVKFASMGSALCFPVEAMVFTVAIFMGWERANHTQLTQADVNQLASQVRVYGDDLIVPTDIAESVIDTLEALSLKVNLRKSFWFGNFRESCGKEYFMGEDVSIVKARRVLPSSRRDVESVISSVSLRNQLDAMGCFPQTVASLDALLFKVLKYFPEVETTSPLLGRVVASHALGERYDPKLHRPVSKGWIVEARIPRNELDSEGALLKFFLKRGGLPTDDERHLERSGRPLAVNIKLVNGAIR